MEAPNQDLDIGKNAHKGQYQVSYMAESLIQETGPHTHKHHVPLEN